MGRHDVASRAAQAGLKHTYGPPTDDVRQMAGRIILVSLQNWGMVPRRTKADFLRFRFRFRSETESLGLGWFDFLLLIVAATEFLVELIDTSSGIDELRLTGIERVRGG